MAVTAASSKKSNQFRLALLFIASTALSVVSAYETFYGLRDFMPEGTGGMVVGIGLTLAVQILMFLICWRIADQFREGFRANLANWSIWGICFLFSAYFSYYGFLHTTGGRNEDIREQAIKSERAEILAKVQDSLTTRLAQDHQTRLLDSEEYRTWTTGSLQSLMAVAATSEEQIAKASKQQRDSLMLAQQDARNRLVPLQKAEQEARVTLELARQKLQQVTADHQSTKNQLDEGTSETARIESDIAGLEASLAQETKTGTGPLAREIELNLNSAKAKLAGISAIRPDLEAKFQALTAQKVELELRAKDELELINLNDVVRQVEEIQAEIRDIEVQLEQSNGGVQFNFDNQQQLLDKGLSELAGQDYTALDRLTKQCSDVKQRLTDTALKDDVAAVQCTNSKVVETVQALRVQKGNLTEFKANCMDPDRYLVFQEVPAGRERLVNAAIDQIADCVARETDPEAKTERNSEVETLKQTRGDNVDPITMASVALLTDRQGNASMSLFLAIIVDVLALLCAVIGKNAPLPKSARAIDALMRSWRPVPGGSTVYEYQVDLSTMDADMRRYVEDLVLPDMIRNDLIDYADDAGNVIKFRNGARARMIGLRNREIGDESEDLGLVSGHDRTTTVPSRRRGLRL